MSDEFQVSEESILTGASRPPLPGQGEDRGEGQ